MGAAKMRFERLASAGKLGGAGERRGEAITGEGGAGGGGGVYGGS